MSFQDLERGLGERAPLARDTGIDPDADLQFKALARTISVQVQKVLANTAAISKFVDLLGGAKDSPNLRKQLSDLTDSTREVLKGSTAEVKRLTDWKLLPSDRQHKQEQQKVSTDFQRALETFQAVARRSVERQRLFVERAKANVEADGGPLSTADEPAAQLLELQQTSISDGDMDFQEQLIQEREGEITQIEQGITELNQIFKDLGHIVSEQQLMIDNIETNVISVARDTHGASTQLTEAHAYQRKAGRRMFCLLLVFLLVLSVVLLAKDTYRHIVTPLHISRSSNLLAKRKSEIVIGGGKSEGKAAEETRKIEITGVRDVKEDDALMQEEIFGPILPMVTDNSKEKMLSIINKNKIPLTLYLFTQSKKRSNYFFNLTPSGTFLQNVLVLQFLVGARLAIWRYGRERVRELPLEEVL
ncbi:hypothetical protein JCM8547_009061 [Rhodosporidiobolus lusitaniae]